MQTQAELIEQLQVIAPALSLGSEGYWVASGSDAVSYPVDGNEECFSIEEKSFWFQHRNAVIADLVRSFPPAGPVFDIGGGNGFVARGLETSGFPCVVVEPGRVGAANSVKRGVRVVVCSTLEAARIRPNSMDAIGLFDVLEHIEDDNAFLRKIHSLLREQGKLYITVPALQGLWSTDDQYAGHHRRYSLSSLDATLKNAGFTLSFSSYFFQCLVLPLLLLRTIPSALGFRRGQIVEQAQQDHAAGKGVLARAVSFLLARERERLQRRQRVSWGTSCIAVATRTVGS